MDTSPARIEETQLRLPRHLKGLEAESIEIMREVVAESKSTANRMRWSSARFPGHSALGARFQFGL
jgi:hypothetical protein